MNSHAPDTAADTATLKITVAWIGTVFGSVNLSDVVLFSTLIFTLLQIYKLAHDLWWPRAPK